MCFTTRNKRRGLTYSRAHALLRLDGEAGRLYWKKGPRSGRRAGSHHKATGYRRVRIDGCLYWEHRVVFLMHYGYFPENLVDHINGDKVDNRPENLREVSHSCNIRNAKAPVTNTSGFVGVSFDKTNNKWRAKIRNNGKHCCLGRYGTALDAALARYTAELCLGLDNCNQRAGLAESIKAAWPEFQAGKWR